MSNKKYAWRTRDIMMVATIGVIFGILFIFWNMLWDALKPLFLFFPPARHLIYGFWLIPAVLAIYIVRKPGVGLISELIAAIVSALIGAKWGIDTIVSGLVQGIGAEIIFGIAFWKNFKILILMLAGAASAITVWIHDWILWYAGMEPHLLAFQLVFIIISGIFLTGLGSKYIGDALKATGVLSGFPIAKEKSEE
jgi:energy-coupling factor transport system substrate-specific component